MAEEKPPPTAFPEADSTGSGSMDFVGGLMADNAARRLADPAAVPGGGGGFLVDPEKAQRAVETLRNAVFELEAAGRGRSRYLAAAGAPGLDPVSVQLGKNMFTMGDRATAWLAAWAGQIRAAQGALQAQIDDYRRVEQENRERLS